MQDSSLMPLQGIEGWFNKSFTEFILEGMYQYVRPSDSADSSTISANTIQNSSSNSNGTDLIILDEIGRVDSVDLLKLNLPTRLLVVLSNVSYLQGEGLRNLLSLFANENISISPSSMVTSLTNVERAVTQLFLQGQVGRIIEPIGDSWLKGASGGDSCVSLSPAIFKSLLSLADVQSLISDVSPRDPLPLLRDLSNTLLSTLLNHLKQLNPSNDQLIQAKIDVEFLKRKLEVASLLSPESHELLDRIALIIDEVDGDFYTIWGQFESNWTASFSNLFSF